MHEEEHGIMYSAHSVIPTICLCVMKSMAVPPPAATGMISNATMFLRPKHAGCLIAVRQVSPTVVEAMILIQ